MLNFWARYEESYNIYLIWWRKMCELYTRHNLLYTPVKIKLKNETFSTNDINKKITFELDKIINGSFMTCSQVHRCRSKMTVPKARYRPPGSNCDREIPAGTMTSSLARLTVTWLLDQCRKKSKNRTKCCNEIVSRIMDKGAGNFIT